jgi:hypothetical protein
MKNKDKIPNPLEKFIKILDAPNKLIFSLFFIISMTFSDKSPDGLLPIAHWAITTDLPRG